MYTGAEPASGSSRDRFAQAIVAQVAIAISNPTLFEQAQAEIVEHKASRTKSRTNDPCTRYRYRHNSCSDFEQPNFILEQRLRSIYDLAKQQEACGKKITNKLLAGFSPTQEATTITVVGSGMVNFISNEIGKSSFESHGHSCAENQNQSTQCR